MKTKAISYFFVLFAIVVGAAAGNFAFADHMTASVTIPKGSSTPGCEDKGTCYTPKEVTVDVGSQVTWTNSDTAAHTVTSGNPKDGPAGVFDSSLFMAGTTYSYKFEKAGTYNYFCQVHPWMAGVVTVQEHSAGETTDGAMIGGTKGNGTTGDETKETYTTDATATGMLSDGTKVSIWTSAPTKDQPMKISVEFEKSKHVNYDIAVTQNDVKVLDAMKVHSHDGKATHETDALKSSDPVNITITFQGFGINDPKTGPIGEKVEFSKVVPEFGTITMMILVVSITSIVAVTAKTRVIPRF